MSTELLDKHNVEAAVARHFEADANRFDAIYESDKSPFMRFVDGVWRGVVRRRLDLTVALLEPLEGKSVLDVGCGSGRFCLVYAQRGASRVVGIDFAPAMIDLAKQYADELGIADRCEFFVGTFPDDMPHEVFDHSSACGFFDYIENPVPLIAKMNEMTRGKIVMSFPKAIEWRVPLRRLRFKQAGCPLFLYRRKKVHSILKAAGIKHYDWIELDRDFLVVGHGSGDSQSGDSKSNNAHANGSQPKGGKPKS